MAEFKKNNSIMEGIGEQDVEAKTLSGNQDVFLRLPYGLAKKEGIDTTGMTPKQVWEALKGKGFNPQQEMDRLARSFSGKQKTNVADLIKRYDIVMHNGNLVIRGMKPNAEEMKELKENKEAIIEHIKETERKKVEAAQERQRKIDNIEGLKELKQARMALEDYHYRYEKSFENEYTSSKPPKRPDINIEELNAKYPRAAAYLKAEAYSNSSDVGKRSAGKKAKERIINGEDYKKVIADMEKEWEDYAKNRIWD